MSPVLSELVFTGYTSRIIAHESVILHYIPETFAHRQIRLRRLKLQQQQQVAVGKKNPLSPSHSPTKVGVVVCMYVIVCLLFYQAQNLKVIYQIYFLSLCQLRKENHFAL